MNLLSRLKKSDVDSARYEIDVEPYDYSREGIQFILDRLSLKYKFSVPEILESADQLLARIFINNETVDIEINNYFCTISFQSQSLCQEVYQYLSPQKKPLT